MSLVARYFRAHPIYFDMNNAFTEPISPKSLDIDA